MDKEQAKGLIHLLKDKDIKFEKGLSHQEILDIEKKIGFRFPPDLKCFLMTGLPISDDFINWRLGLNSNEELIQINNKIEWPLEGMIFDIKNNDFWINAWGAKPKELNESINIARKHYVNYPKLIPICSHRYIPSSPLEDGNPVFSIYQMDIIYYGYDLSGYLANEFKFTLPEIFKDSPKEPRFIEFWSNFADI